MQLCSEGRCSEVDTNIDRALPTQQLEDDLFKENTSSRAVRSTSLLYERNPECAARELFNKRALLCPNVQIRGRD